MSARADLTPHGKCRACWIAGIRFDSLREGADELRRLARLTRPEAKVEYHTLINALRYGKESLYGIAISGEAPVSRAPEYRGLEERTRRHQPGRDPLLPGACAHRLGYNPSRFE